MAEVELAPNLHVSRETFAALKELEALTLKWSQRINLVARSTEGALWQRHIVDSAQLMPLFPAHARTMVDVGSGGGFPGLVIAVLRKQTMPHLEVTLVDSDSRKTVFLREAARQLDLNVSVVTARIEEVGFPPVDVVTARALAPLVDLLPFAERALAPEGRAIFPKGEKADQEIARARMGWRFSVSSHPSITNPDAKILCLERICRD